MLRASLAAAALGVAVLAFAAPARPDPAGSPPASAALRVCRLGDDARPEQRAAIWQRGLAIAEDAVARHPDDPVAHFALFCNLGRRVSQDGVGLAAMASAPRLRRHIDRALALDPGYVDALAAKGAFLARLPRLLGGDAKEGERLVRRALAIDPTNPGAHLALALVLRRLGRADEGVRTPAPAKAPAAPGGGGTPAGAAIVTEGGAP